MALQRLAKDVLLEETCAFDTVREDHDTDSMLNTLIPHPHVSALIGPHHDTVSIALILIIVPFVSIAGLPFENTVAMLLVVLVHAFI